MMDRQLLLEPVSLLIFSNLSYSVLRHPIFYVVVTKATPSCNLDASLASRFSLLEMPHAKFCHMPRVGRDTSLKFQEALK